MERAGHNYFIIVFLMMVSSVSNMSMAQIVDVNLTRGHATVNLPIATIRSGNLSAPIGISYGSGVRVVDGEANVGVGWTLSAGGTILREVRGLPDDFIGSVSVASDTRNGWLHEKHSGSVHERLARWPRNFAPQADLNYSVCSDEWDDWKRLDSLKYDKDTEPDMFYISAPGLRGQFVFNNYRIVKTIPYMDVKIQVTRGADSLINQIKITNNLGTQYTFDAGDKVTRQSYGMNGSTPGGIKLSSLYYYLKPATYYRSWYLSSIQSSSGASISFAYGNTEQNYEPYFNRQISSGTLVDSAFVVLDLVTIKKILTITGSNETATFGWSGSLLNSVVVSEGSYGTTERYNFQFAHVSSTSTDPLAMKQRRNFLIGFYKDVNCNVLPGYKFEYHGVNLSTNLTDIPFGTDLKQDMFGYFNGSGTSLVPLIYWKSDALDAEAFRLSSASGYSYTGSTTRAVDTAKVYMGSLKKLTYPTGGYDLIKYESASYYDDLTSSSILGGGPRVKSIKSSSGDAASDITKTYKYVQSNGLSSGQWTYRPIFVINYMGQPYAVPENQAPETSLLYSRVEVMTTGRGKSVFEYLNKGIYPQLTQNDYRVGRTRIARPQASYCYYLYSAVSNQRFYCTPNSPNTNYDFERELLTRKSDYSISGKLVSRKLITYQRTSSQLDSIIGLKFVREPGDFEDVFVYSKYALVSNVAKTVLLEKTRLYDQVSNDTTKVIETTNKYVLNSDQLLAQVKSISSEGDSLFSIYKYPKDYAGTGTDTQSTMINGLVAANRHATVIETITKRGSNYTGGSLTLFNNNFGGSRILPSQQLALGNPSGFTPSSVSGATFVSSNSYFTEQYFDAYDNIGNVLATHDRSRNVKSVILGHNKTFPVLDILNARYDQVVFTDFEPNISTSLTYTGSLSTDSWSGKKSLSLTTSNQVSQSGVSKGGNYYRFSCWVKGSSNATISVTINSGTPSTAAYLATGWKYVEKRIDMTGVSSTFSFVLTTSSNVLIDNITFYPESADVATHTYEPLIGKSADLDDRGGAAFQEFDAFGRPHFARNVDKDIVTIKEYGYKNPGVLLPNTSFTHNVPLNEIMIGGTVVFSISDECYSSVSYSWYVNDVIQSTSTSLSYQFNSNKNYYVRLEAVVAGILNSRVILVHPLPWVAVTLSVGGANTHFTCQDVSANINVTATVTGYFTSSQTMYQWYYIKNGVRTDLSFSSSNVISYSMDMGANNYLYCIVHAKSLNESTGNYDFIPVITSPVQFFEWIREEPCPNGW